MVPKTAGKRTGASKGSRHTKKYWRKGTNVDDIEDVIHAAGREKATGGVVAEMKDDDIFVVDREIDATKKLIVSKKQQAALDKITRSIDKDLISLPAPKRPVGKIAKLPKGNAILKGKKVAKKTTTQKKSKLESGKYDVWGTDLVPKVELNNEKAAEHYLRYTKKKQPNTRLKAVTSLLPAVQIAEAGASYNPEAEEYSEYVNRIAVEEQELINCEEKIKNGIEPRWEKKATEQEKFLEMAEGLKIHPRYGKDDEEEDVRKETASVDKEKGNATAVVCERLTKEQKKKKATATKIDLAEKRRLAEKAREIDSHNVYRTKQITKELEEEEKTMEEQTATNKRKKVLEKMTTRQKLGRGEFKDVEDPFLLQEELSGNLRQLRPQGHVLEDRMKSLQRRNILPIGGAHAKKLKKSLKRKFVEKRSVKDVKKGSRVI